MTTDHLHLTLQELRGLDSNSLLRMYDRACSILGGTSSEIDRGKADKVVQRIAGELAKRDIRFDPFRKS